MTNEELALSIKDGQQELIEELWSQTERFVRQQAYRFMSAWSLRCTQMCVDEEDLYQVGYFALLDSIDAFKNEYKFMTYFGYHLKRQFYKLTKMNYTGWQNNTVYRPAELDENRISDTDDIEAAIERVYVEQVRVDIDKALECTTEHQRDAITFIYFYGLTREACAKALGLTKGGVNRLCGRAFAQLRPALSNYREVV